MQNSAAGVRTIVGVVHYRERLSPSLWTMVAAGFVAPMAALAFSPIDSTLALFIGAAVGVGFIGLLIASSPIIEIRDGVLTAGRARIPVYLLGESRVFVGDDARHARGAGLHPRAWHVIRGGIDPVLTVAVIDPDDPAPEWVLSSRTPDRLAAALRRAQATPRTPGR
jgi:hypothetical protein